MPHARCDVLRSVALESQQIEAQAVGNAAPLHRWPAKLRRGQGVGRPVAGSPSPQETFKDPTG
eukprot:6394575-Alexandrium_andersonii.AAC.1